MVNKSEQKPEQKHEISEEKIQGKAEKIEIDAIEIIKEKPIYELYFNDWGHEYYHKIYLDDLKKMKNGEYFGDLDNQYTSQRLTKIYELPQGDLYLLETRTFEDAEKYKITRKFILFLLH